MARYLICLANSRKYSGRCVAGVELLVSQQPGKRFEIKSINGRPAWIRPISGIGFGQVDETLVKEINLLDIIKIRDLANTPDGFQTENVLFEPDTIEVLENVPLEERFLDKLIALDESLIFGNDTNALSPSEIEKLKYSLVLIKPEKWSCHHLTNIYGKSTRMEFTHNRIIYNLPITDIGFCNSYEDCPAIIDTYKNLYLAISLGKFFKGYYYKLVAGVIGCT